MEKIPEKSDEFSETDAGPGSLTAEGKAEKTRILVVGGEDTFSVALVNYSISMAKRLNFDIAALNVVPLGRHLASFLGDKNRDEMIQSAQFGCGPFREKAEQSGLAFEHSVLFGDVDAAIKEAYGKLKPISYVLTEPLDSAKGGSGGESIPVFCFSEA